MSFATSLYAAPAVLSAEPFALLPDALRRSGVRTHWADANKRGEALHSFLEGPCFDHQGRLCLVDIPHGRILRVADGEWSVLAAYEGEPNGMKVTADGRLLVTDYRRGLVLVDAASGNVAPLLERYRVEGFKGLNDLACAANGDIYFTDQGLTGLHDPTGRVFRLRPDRCLDLLVDNLPSPNGIVLDLNETALLVTHHCDIIETGNESWRFKNRA